MSKPACGVLSHIVSAKAFDGGVKRLRLADTCNVRGCSKKTFALISVEFYNWSARVCKKHYTNRSNLVIEASVVEGTD